MVQLPPGVHGQAARIRPLVAGERQQVDVETGPSAKAIRLPHMVEVEQGKDQGGPSGVVVHAQPLEGEGVGGHIVAFAEALGEQAGGQRVVEPEKGGAQPESVTPQIGIVGGAVDVETPTPGLIEVESPLAEDVPAHIVLRIRGDAGLHLKLAVAQALAVFGRQHGPLFGGQHGDERQALVGGDVDVIRHPHHDTQVRRGADARREEAGTPVHGRIRVQKIRRIGDRYPPQLQPGVAVLHGPFVLVVDHLDRPDLPKRGAGRVYDAQTARGIDGVAQLYDPGVRAPGAAGGEAGAVGENEAQVFDDAVL